MTPVWTPVLSFEGARGKGAMLLRDPRRPGVWALVRTFNGDAVYIEEMGEEQATEFYLACWLDVGGESSWNAVLERLLHPERSQVPSPWEGSPAQYASRYFEIGTWEWVLTLMDVRARSLGTPETPVSAPRN